MRDYADRFDQLDEITSGGPQSGKRALDAFVRKEGGKAKDVEGDMQYEFDNWDGYIAFVKHLLGFLPKSGYIGVGYDNVVFGSAPKGKDPSGYLRDMFPDKKANTSYFIVVKAGYFKA